MATLQRSGVLFRRQGSSGAVWDDRFLSRDSNQMDQNEEGKLDHREMRPCQSSGIIGMMERSRLVETPPIRARSSSLRAINLLSPKVIGCGFLGAFDKSVNRKKPDSGKHAL